VYITDIILDLLGLVLDLKGIKSNINIGVAHFEHILSKQTYFTINKMHISNSRELKVVSVV
jgi:hypothetical protein